MLCRAAMLFTVLVISFIDTTKSKVHFRKHPGTTVGVLGGEAHLEWEYESRNLVTIILWYQGVRFSSVGTYIIENDTLTAFNQYEDKLRVSVDRRDSYNVAVLTIVDLQSSYAGNYTATFEETPDAILDAPIDTYDRFNLEVAKPDALGRREICCGGICYENLNEGITLYKSGDVRFRFTKNGHLSSDMYLDVVTSSGASCHHVPADNVANCSLGDPATLVNKEFVNMTITYGKNGRQFYTEAFQIKFLTSSSTVPNAGTSGSTVRAFWKDLAIFFATLLTIVLVSVFVYVAYEWHRGAYARVQTSDNSAPGNTETPTDATSAGGTGDDQPPNHGLQTVNVEHLSNVNGHGGAPEGPDSGVGPSSANTTFE